MNVCLFPALRWRRRRPLRSIRPLRGLLDQHETDPLRGLLDQHVRAGHSVGFGDLLRMHGRALFMVVE
ncbi:hypothetical protein [Rathayibacter sp. VKM Ac-2857]|uniref:hypothetical protein n=1 Tax=Rathayibacter sp. VKM Ac-2857 TaxID=2739020 RepID=UPI001566B516|nr:hypothetical protein [Rathayibacter sp. VKM Ac-2857]NQX16982.1 hypothetical protein [Rathayibacter sp. VKM Ac-2857]